MSVEAVYFNHPPLVLTEDATQIGTKIGYNLGLSGDLAKGINTDTIIPADACKTPDPEELARYVLTGWHDDQVHPDNIRQLHRNVWVAGTGFGSGSSREHAPIAIMHSGCSIVVAQSFAPIFRRNAVALGLYTSTDFGLLDEIAAGKPIPLAKLTEGLDELSQEIVTSGGLLPYLQKIQRGTLKPPTIETQPRPMTIAEKWLSRYLGVSYVKPGDGGLAMPDFAYSYEYTAPLSIELLKRFTNGTNQINNPNQLVFFNDHLSLDNDPRAHKLQESVRQFAHANGIRLYDAASSKETPQGSLAICHVKMTDIVKPGLHVGTDSHTPMIAPVGGYVFGIGATDFAGVIKTGKVITIVPESVRININGTLPPFVTSRDIMLHLIAQDRQQQHYLGRVMEFGGSGLSHLSLLDLAILANMSAEARAVTATFEPHQGIARYLVHTGRAATLEEALELFPSADQSAQYAATEQINLANIQPTVATPKSPDSGKPLSELPRLPINTVMVGSCVGGSIEDIRLLAHIIKDRTIHPSVRLIVHPHSEVVLRYAQQQGWLEWITKAGGKIETQIGCGECIGASPDALQPGDVCITTDSRNHTGRMGHASAQVYLANTIVCAVTALKGHLPTQSDLQEQTLGVPWNEKVTLFSNNT